VSLNCGTSAGGGVSPSTPSIEPEAIKTPAPASEIPSPTTEVDTPASAVGQNVGLSASPDAAPLPAGAVQMESGLNAYVAYPDGGKPNDTCFLNPSAPTSDADSDYLDTVKYSVRRGQTLSWTQLSHISGVEHCADGERFIFSAGVANVAKYGKKCKKLGTWPSYGSYGDSIPADGAITVAGGMKAKKKGKCRITIRSDRGGVVITQGRILLRIR
jgi:hypothetical protein